MGLAVALAALALAAPSGTAPIGTAPPPAGVLVPGRSLGGLELGLGKPEVERRWGRAYGVCRGCARETWYFNYYAFRPRGAAVEWRDGRVAAIFTLWQPAGWRTPDGLALGDSAARVTRLYGRLLRSECGRYSVLRQPGRTATTAFYLLDDRLWAFGLSRPGLPLCR